MAWEKVGTHTIKPVAVGLLARGGKYTVKDLGNTMQGYAEIVRNELGVSRNGALPWTRWVQNHELTHVEESKFSPKTIMRRAKIKKLEYVLAAEDARINSILVDRVPDAHEGFAHTGRSLRMSLDGYLASWRSPACIRDAMRDELLKQDPANAQKMAKIDALCAKLEKGKRTVTSMLVPLCRLMEKLEGAPAPSQPSSKSKPNEQGEQGDEQQQGEDEQDEQQKGDGDEQGDEGEEQDEQGKGKGDSEDEGEDEAEDEDGEGEGEEAEDEGDGESGQGTLHAGEAEEQARDEQEYASENETAEDEADSEKWNPLGLKDPNEHQSQQHRWYIPEVLTPQCAKTVQRPGTHDWSSSDTGTEIRNICRIASDGLIFGRRRASPGTIRRGTFLIDASGSMQIEMSDIASIITAVPHATIAIYSGGSRFPGIKGEAWIVIVAKDGKMVADLHDWRKVPRSGANACDGPALLWLSRMPGFRFWYADGYVNGKEGTGSASMTDEVEAIVRVGRITHVCADAGGGSFRPFGKMATSLRRGRGESHGDFVVRALKSLKCVR